VRGFELRRSGEAHDRVMGHLEGCCFLPVISLSLINYAAGLAAIL
jgi:hypothetical protein